MAAAFGGFSVALGSYAAPAGTCLLLALAARYYGGRRNDPNLSSALESTAPLSYIAAAAALPLQDAAFDSMDRALGSDWKALLAVMERWPEFYGCSASPDACPGCGSIHWRSCSPPWSRSRCPRCCRRKASGCITDSMARMPRACR